MAKKPSITTISSGYASTTTLNANFEALKEAFENTLSRDGSTPNSMNADLDMNSNDILNASRILVGGQDYLALSLSYKNAALAAQVAAETAETNAQTSETNAATSATSASSSAASAAASVASIGTSVSDAAASATAAAASEANAATSATNASNSASSANTSATTASTSATAAQAAQTAAETAKTAAQSAQAGAETAETNAASSATAAASSASSASTSATSATASQTAAAASATAAAASETAASTSETNAAASASTASTAATTATTQATAAATSATNAATSASSAATSATSASSSATAAQAAQTGAEAAYDSFDDRYLGAKSLAPTTDNDGDPLLTGALYYNTTAGQLYIWTGSAWDDAAFSASGSVTSFNTRVGSVTLNSTDVANASGLLTTNNLSDLANAATARTNLGLGTTDSPTFAGATLTGTVSVSQSVSISLGSSGTQTTITNDGFGTEILDNTGNTFVTTDTFSVIDSLGNMAGYFTPAGPSVLNYANTAALSTTATGVSVTGDIAVSGTVDGRDVAADGTKLDTAYGWGDHASAGYLTTETDPVYVASSWYSTTNNSTNWNTAYSWGNHASAGYLTGNQTITLSGDVSGSGTTSIVVTVADDSHNHVISNVDGLQTALDGKAALAGSASQAFSASTLNATTVDLGDWTVTESAGVLYFAYQGTNKMKVDSSGNLTVTGNVTAYGTV